MSLIFVKGQIKYQGYCLCGDKQYLNFTHEYIFINLIFCWINIIACFIMLNFYSALWRPIFKKYSGTRSNRSETGPKHRSIESMKQECMTRWGLCGSWSKQELFLWRKRLIVVHDALIHGIISVSNASYQLHM